MDRETRQNRLVTTFCVDGWPVGVLTGCERANNVYYLEHVLIFPDAPRGTLMKVLKGGIDEAWALKFGAIVFCLPDDFPPSRQLESVGVRLGFVPYAHENGMSWWVRHKD